MGIFIPCTTEDEIKAHSEARLSHPSARGFEHVSFDYMADLRPRFQSYKNDTYFTKESQVWLYPILDVDAAAIHRACVEVAREMPVNNFCFRCSAIFWCLPCNCGCLNENDAIGPSSCVALTMRIIARAKTDSLAPYTSDPATFTALGMNSFSFAHPCEPSKLAAYAPRAGLEAMQKAKVIDLSVEELARLAEHTSMNALVRERNKKQQAAAKRKALGPQIVDSPRTQLRKNQELAKKAAAKEKQRQEQIRANKKAKEEEEAARERQRREDQRRAAEDVEMPDAGGGEGEGVPRQRARPRAMIPLPTPVARVDPFEGLPKPEHVETPTWKSVSSIAVAGLPSSIEDLKPLVRSSIDLVVLCAPRPDGEVRTWNELEAPPADSPFAADWASWLSPAKWKSMSDAWRLGNTQQLEKVTEAGNYNDVLTVSAGTPVNDSSAWPPQLRGSGVDVTEDTAVVATLPRADYVIRTTRTDPFPSEAGEVPTYRAMRLESVVDEMSLALQAAAQGIGPPIYAAVACPWDHGEKQTSEQRYGMILIMRKADGNMADWTFNVRKTGLLGAPAQELKRTVEQAADFLVNLCFHIGSTQHINYDMKQGNLLMHEVSGSFYMTDFDAMYYRYMPPETAGVKACFFVNLLLLAMHVRAYAASTTVTDALLGVFSPILVEIWNEAVNSPATSGQGFRWLREARISPTYETGSFNHRTLNKLQPGPRIGRQLSMMVFEYLFDKSDDRRPPPAATEWKHWDLKQGAFFQGGFKPLVPQLMRFVVLYNRPVPSALRSLFEPDVEMQPVAPPR